MLSKVLLYQLTALIASTITMGVLFLFLLHNITTNIATTTTLPRPRVYPRINNASIVSHGPFVHNDSRCQGRHIYVYPLPPEFNEDIVARCLESDNNQNTWNNVCSNLDNQGLGPLIPFPPPPPPSLPLVVTRRKVVFDQEGSWFQTGQFALELIFHHRIKTYECLTPDPSLADAFYIPYYGGLDVALNLFNPHTTHLRDQLVERLMGWLGSNRVWRSTMAHKPQFIVLGRIGVELGRDYYVGLHEWGSSLMTQPQMFNVTKLIIERKGNINKEMGIPYPTPFHPSSPKQIQSWQELVKGSERKWMVTFVGTTHRARTLREALIRQCKEHPSRKCRMVECADPWFPGVNLLQCVDEPEAVLQIFTESVFCMQPGGDSPTRKSIFDSLLAGCIPVLFSKYSAYTQYHWHLPLDDPTSWSVYYPQEKILLENGNDDGNGNGNGNDVISFLEKINSKDIKRMQETIINLIPQILYAQKPWPSNINSSEDIKDAFDIVIENVLRNTPTPFFELAC